MKQTEKLTAARVGALEPRDKPYKVADGDGLYLYVAPSGGKSWRLDYVFSGTAKTLTIGKVRDFTPKEAREKAREARQALANGADPAALKKAHKLARSIQAQYTWGAVFDEWLGAYKAGGGGNKRQRPPQPRQLDKIAWLRTYLEPLTVKDIQTLRHRDFSQIIRQMVEADKIVSAAELARMVNKICLYARRQGFVDLNVAADLQEDIPTVASSGRPAVETRRDIAEVLRKIDSHICTVPMKYALRLMPFTVLRTGELAGAEWSEIDIKAALWTVPSSRMKIMGNAHKVPLSNPAIILLRELQSVTGGNRFLFPGREKAREAPITPTAISRAFRRAGVEAAKHSLHGWRAVFSTWANESGYNRDAIERQLAHEERNRIRRAYDRGERMEERRAIMAAWGTYLEETRLQEK